MSLDRLNITALRSSSPGSDPQLSKVAASAAGLLRDLQALSATQEQLGRVATQASVDAQGAVEDPDGTLEKLCGHLKELVCSYVYTYDEELSEASEMPSSQTYLAPTHEKDPAKLLMSVTTPTTIPALPGNLLYLACGDDVQTVNPDLYAVLTSQNFQDAHVGETDTQKITALMPLYTIPGTASLPMDLRNRWADLLALTAQDTWQLTGGYEFSVKTSALEAVPIVGLRTVAGYQAFMALQELDSWFEQISVADARRLTGLYQEEGEDPNHKGVWLAYGKLALLGKATVTDVLMGILTERRDPHEFQDFWNWLGSTPTPGVAPNLSLINDDPDLYALQQASMNYADSLRESLLTGFEVDDQLGSQAKATAFQTKITQWRTTLKQQGGVLGAQAVLLVAALTALERVRVAANQRLSEELVQKYGTEGSKIASYLFNAEPLQDAFAALGG